MNADTRVKVKNISFYTLVMVFSILLPLVLDLGVLSPLVDATFKDRKLFEFFGLSGFLAVVMAIIWTIKQNRPADLLGYAEVLLPAFIALIWLNTLTERTFKDWDYVCYEDAAKFLLNGKNPYEGSLDCYFYPPLLVLALSKAYHVMQFAVAHLHGFPLESEKAWTLIFYLYQCLQWFLVILAFFLGCRLAEKFGLPKNVSLGVVTLLFILNNPLLRTLHFFQINLWILTIAMLVLLYNASHPFISGLLAALGAHIKLYPTAFVASWGLLKDKRALAGFALGILLPLALIHGSFGSSSIWRQFIEQDPSNAGGYKLRDNSLHSLIYNSLRITNVIQPGDLNSRVPETMTSFFTVLVLLWFLIRLTLRYRMLMKAQDPEPLNSFIRDGMFVDMVGLMLLASPVAWEHHYVLAIPVFLWTLALQLKEGQLPIASFLAFLFIFALPTFDVFPFSYLRLTGLLILLVISDPIAITKRSMMLEAPKTVRL